MKIILLILLVLLIIELICRPRIDFTRNGKCLLWYGRKVRKYIEL